jgi:hypothetical protein
MLTNMVKNGAIVLDDDVPMEHLGPALKTMFKCQPPPLERIIHVTGTTTLCGSYGNRLYFSNELTPDDWPVEHEITFPERIVNIGALNMKVMVTTEGRGYVVDGATNCDPKVGRQVVDADTILPDIGRTRRSSVVTPFGLVYVSADGLTLLSPDSAVSILTADWFNRTQWSRMCPGTVMLTYWRGRIVFINLVSRYMLAIDHDSYKGFQLGALTELSDKYPLDIMTTDNGELLLLHPSGLEQFDAGDELRTYRWESAPLPFHGETAPTVLKLGLRPTAEGVRILLRPELDRISAQEEIYETKVYDDRPVRLKRLGRNKDYILEIRGSAPVDYAYLGTSLSGVDKGE